MRRKKPKTLIAKRPFLEEAERFHRLLINTRLEVRLGEPDYQALDRLSDALIAAVSEINGSLPWVDREAVSGTGVAAEGTRLMEERRLREATAAGTIGPCADASPDTTPGQKSTRCTG